MTEGWSEALLDVVARGASPWERLGGQGLEPAGDGDAGREAAWVRAAAAGDEAAFHRLLARRGIDADAWRRSLGAARVADPARLPAWAHALREMHSALEAPPAAVEPLRVGEIAPEADVRSFGLDADAVWPHFPAFAPFLALGARVLEREAAAAGFPVAPSARRRLLAQLAQRWAGNASQVLLHRVGVADVLTGHPGAPGEPVFAACFGAGDAAAGWARLFALYPALARVLAVAFTHWRQATRELLDRLAADRALLSATFAGGALGALADVAADAGDLHGFGRSVALLAFTGGTRIAYKPKDLRVASAYLALVGELNARGLQPPLHTRKFVARDGYAWDEVVEAAPCADLEGVRRYYRRMGMHARLLQLLEATDCIGENLLPRGDHPVLVDLETLLTPRVPRAGGPAGPAHALAADNARDAPLRCGIVSARVTGEAGRRPADLGALAPPGEAAAPFRRALLRRRDDGSAEVVQDYSTMTIVGAAPVLDGAPIPSDGFFAEVVEGYVAMARALREAGPSLAAADGAVARFAGLPVRFIYRDTHVYFRLLEESLRPAALRDGVSREMVLERLWKPLLRDTGHADMVRAETDALRRLDIPLFGARAGESAAVTETGAEVPGLFEGSALEKARERLARLAQRTDAEERETIGAALFVLHPSPVQPAPAAISPAAPSTPDWLGAAAEIGRVLARSAARAGGEAAWTGVHYQPRYDAWRLGVLPDDLLNGAAGITLALAELHAATGDGASGDAARAGLATLLRRLPELAKEPGLCGAMRGWGGVANATVRAALALGDDASATAATAVLTTIPSAAMSVAGADAVSGTAGLALSLADLRARGVSVPDALAEAAAASLRAARDAGFPAPKYPPDAATLGLLPGTRAGIELALLRLAGEKPVAPGDGETVGDVIARLAIARHAPDTLETALAAMDRLPSPDVVSGRTRALLDAAEVALAAFAATGDEAHFGRAEAYGRAILETRRRWGRFLPDALAADRHFPCAVLGVGAVARLFLRLHARRGTGSLRVLD